ncbi:MAG: twin transmembrane helix small protein [Alphaproteobacteria bacterium]|nr:twin transmembrane helix small protein [Alphaproteobacteria bacterium]
MNLLSSIILGSALLAVAGVLVLGILSMARGGEFNKKYGNRLMQARVILQGLVLALLAVAYLAS